MSSALQKFFRHLQGEVCARKLQGLVLRSFQDSLEGFQEEITNKGDLEMEQSSTTEGQTTGGISGTIMRCTSEVSQGADVLSGYPCAKCGARVTVTSLSELGASASSKKMTFEESSSLVGMTYLPWFQLLMERAANTPGRTLSS